MDDQATDDQATDDQATDSTDRPRLQRGWHCVYDMHYPLVLTVKYRRALLDPQVVAELTRISLAIQGALRVPGSATSSRERYEFQIEALGADLNLRGGPQPRPHALLGAPEGGRRRHRAHLRTSCASSDIVRIFKSLSARELFKALPALRKDRRCARSCGAARSGRAAVSRRRSGSSAATRASGALSSSRGRRPRT